MSEVLALADEYWEYYRTTAQLWNIDRGDLDQIEHWEDLSPDGVAHRVERLHRFADAGNRLSGGDPEGDEAAALAAICFSARATASVLPWMRDRLLVSAPVGFAAFLPLFVPRYALVTAEHGSGYLSKLHAFPHFVDGWLAGLRDGVRAGRVATSRGVLGSIEAYEALLAGEMADDPLASQAPPAESPAEEAGDWRQQVQEAVTDAVRPALARLRDGLRDEVLPHSRSDEEPGMCHLPGGVEGYAGLLWASTSTTHTPEAVHQLGLELVEGLEDEFRSLSGPTLGTEDLELAFERLRDDPSLRYTDPAEIVRDAELVLARAMDAASTWFTRLPEASCNAVAVDRGWLAFYTAPSPGSDRGGTFFFNTSDPTAWGFQLEATTFHEAVPGHHLQLALAQELGLHPVCAELEVTSYEEGWGLYAERLADEMGLYSSPLQRIGMLALESLRACRLVVDTGLHARGWTRQRAIDFVYEHTPQTRQVAEAEVDRYIADPGQATAYMIGRLELDRLRHEAHDQLGPRFELPRFHEVVLGGGMMPLDQLSRRVRAWTARLLKT